MTRYLKRYKDSHTDDIESLPPGGLTPVQVCKAYEYMKLKPLRQIKMGIVSLGGYFSQSDTESAFKQYTLPLPSITTSGTQYPNDDLGTEENMLDIQCLGVAYSYSTGQSALIIEQFEQRDIKGMARAIKALVDTGCEVISISWGWPASEQPIDTKKARAEACAYAANANCHIFAASGDNSIDDNTDNPTPDDPCSDTNVWGVGGTSLTLDADGKKIRESVWGDGKSSDQGGGGGFDKEIPIPLYQQGIVTGQYRGTPDSSAHANPGYTLFALGRWMLMGGTSASAPITAGYIAAILSTLAKPISQQSLQTLLYKNYQTAFNDITIGSDGYPAAPGWDPASGCGSINGSGMVKAFSKVE